MSPEMYNFHQVITELQIAEDNMLDNHKQTNEQLHIITEKAERLLRTADDVTYDQEGAFFIDHSTFFIHLLFYLKLLLIFSLL